MLIADAQGIIAKDLTLPDAVSQALASADGQGQTLYIWDESDGTSMLTVGPLTLAPARQYRQVLNYLLGRRQRSAVPAEDESALISLADGYYACMTPAEQVDADAWWDTYQQPTSSRPAARVSTATDAVQAPQVVQVLAAHLEAQGVTSLRFIRYTPRSGAARRAIAEGADPVPLLMDTDEYGTFSTAPIHHAMVGAPATEETVRAQYDLDPGEALALTTTLGIRSGIVRHLMMLDFSEPLAEEATRLLISAITHAGWSGYLLASGASYHFLGSDALELGEWYRQMSFAMLTPGLEGRNAIDVRYMAHTLFNNRGGLRITRGAQKGMVPHLLASFGSAPAVGGGAR